jgi:hypothetical protein
MTARRQILRFLPAISACVAAVLAACAIAGGNGVLALSRLMIDGGVVLLWAMSAAGLGGAVMKLMKWPSGGLPLAMGVGLGLLSTGQLLLGLAGIMGAGVAWGMLVPGWVLGAWVLRGTKPPEGGMGWEALLVVPPAGLMLLLALLPAGLLFQGEPNGYDVLAYHLQLPREWLEIGRIVPLTHNVFSFLPLAVEMHYLLAMQLLGGPFHGVYAAQLMHAVFFLTAAGAAYGAVRPAGRLAALLAGLAMLATPHVLTLAPIAYNEGALLLYGVLVLTLLLQHPLSWRSAVLAGLCAGFAAGAKLTALPLLVAAPVVALLLTRKVKLAPLAAFVLVSVAVVSPWLVRTAVWSGGNPVFPLAATALGTGHHSPELVARFEKAHSPRADQEAFGARLREFWRQVIGASDFAYTLVPVGLVCGLLAVKSPLARALLILLGLHAVFWLGFTHLQSRFFVPAIPVLAMLVALAAPQIRVGVLCVLVGTMLFAVANVWGRLEFLRNPATGELQTQVIGVDYAAFAAQVTPAEVRELPGGTRLVLVGEARAFLYTRPMRSLKYTSVFDAAGTDARTAWRVGEGEAALVSPSELQRLARTYGTPPPPPEWRDEQTFLLRP